jgi:hypothetical protein
MGDHSEAPFGTRTVEAFGAAIGTVMVLIVCWN